MKSKNYKGLLFVLFFFATAYYCSAMRPYNGPRRHRHHDQPSGQTEPVGAPLDGGLLAVLGAAGVSYYLIRKKNQGDTKE